MTVTPPVPVLTPAALASEVSDLAQRAAPSLPSHARRLLRLAAEFYRDCGEPAAALDCLGAAGSLRDLATQPRSQPYCPPTVEAAQEQARRIREAQNCSSDDECRDAALVHAEADERCGREWFCSCARCRAVRGCTCQTCELTRQTIRSTGAARDRHEREMAGLPWRPRRRS